MKKVLGLSGFLIYSFCMSNNQTPARPKLTKTETETLTWMKSGRIGSGPARRTGNTHNALERKGYVVRVSLGNNTCGYEYP